MSDANNDENSGGEVTALHDLIAGGIAGSASVIVGHPFDTIKVRLQTSSASSSSGNAKNGKGPSSSTSTTSLRSLFKGMAAPLSTAAIVNAIIFASYGSSTRLWEDVFENGQHEDSHMHGTMSREGVMIEKGEHGTHEQLKSWKKKQRQLSSDETHDAHDANEHAGLTGFGGLAGGFTSHPDEVKDGMDAAASSAASTNSTNAWVDSTEPSIMEHEPIIPSSSMEESSFATESTPLQTGIAEIAETMPQPMSEQQQNLLKVFTCGSIAGTVQAFVICPMEHIKCRLQVQSAAAASSATATAATTALPTANLAVATAGATATAVPNPVTKILPNPATTLSSTTPHYKGPIDCGLSIIKNHGLFRGLFRGMGVTLWRETPAFGLYFATYDSIKEKVETLLEEKDHTHPIPSHAHAWAASALAGGISGALTWAIIYPFDVIKSRIQTGPLEVGEGEKPKGMWVVGREIVREHGWRYMFRGLGVTLVRAFPVNAIIFPVYEFVLLQLGDG